VSTDKTSELVSRAINEYFASAKRSQTLAIAIQMFIVGAGILAVFVPNLSPSYPPVAVVSTMVLAVVKFNTDDLRGKAERLKRAYEFADSFGEGVAKKLLAEIDVSSPRHLSSTDLVELSRGVVFASATEQGPRRALENLQESAWWSNQNARLTAHILCSIAALIFTSALIILIVVTVAPGPHDLSLEASVGRIVASTLLCVFSLNLIQTVIKLYRFAAKAGAIDDEAEHRLDQTSSNPIDTMRLLSEYQIARASAPMIPTFIWKLRAEKLNGVWTRHKARGINA
jgi:hypothetical protein